MVPYYLYPGTSGMFCNYLRIITVIKHLSRSVKKRQDLDECALCGLPEESLVRGLGVAVVSAAADPGRSGVLTQGRAHMTWHASRQVLTGLCHVACVPGTACFVLAVGCLPHAPCVRWLCCSSAVRCPCGRLLT